MQHNTDPVDSGPCARRVVKATLLTERGNTFTATNYCLKPQTVCPRGNMPTGVGYELCKSVCHQQGHAEENVLNNVSPHESENSVLTLEGHTYMCSNCGKIAHEMGVKVVRVVLPKQLKTVLKPGVL